MYPKTDIGVQYRINEINKIKYHFIAKSYKGKTMS